MYTWRATIKASKRKKSIATAAVVIVVALGGFGAYYFFSKGEQLSENEKALRDIGEHILLPSDESPAVLTITDKTKITSAFLEKTENGDKILVYQKAQRAIIYRPAIDKIVDVGPVIIDEIESKEE